MRDLEGVIIDKAFTSQKFAVGDHVYSVEKAENFEYIDPVDGSVTRNQVSCSCNRMSRKKSVIFIQNEMLNGVDITEYMCIGFI